VESRDYFTSHNISVMTLLFTGLAIYRKTLTNGGIFHNKNLHGNSAYHRRCKRKTSLRIEYSTLYSLSLAHYSL